MQKTQQWLIPNKGPLHKSPADRFINYPPLLLWIRLFLFGKSERGLSKWGLRFLSTTAYDCRHFMTKAPLGRGPTERPQNCTIVYDCAQIAESGLKPLFAKPHPDFPDIRGFGVVGEHNSGGAFCCILGTVGRQPPPANPFLEAAKRTK